MYAFCSVGVDFTRKISFQKRSMILLFFLMLFVFQLIIVKNFNIIYFTQSVILDLLIITGIYAFRGFEFKTAQSIINMLVAYAAGTILGGLLTLLITVIFFDFQKLPGIIFISTSLFAIFALSLFGWYLMNIMIKRLNSKRYLVIGRESELKGIMDEIERDSMRKIKVYKYINPTSEILEQEIENTKDNSKISRPFDAILIGNMKLAKSVSDVFDNARKENIPIEYLPNLVEDILKRIPIEIIEGFEEYYDVAFSRIEESPSKRIIDLGISILSLAILSPVFLILYMAIILTDGKPTIFTQKRVGLNNSNFIIHKIRTMKKIDDLNLQKYVIDEQHRITKLGRVIRPIRLDEIPQFYDILRGEMSFIGPRPEQPKFVEELSQKLPYYKLRHLLKPGLSGWAQINYQYAATIEEQSIKLSYDLYYIKNRNVLLDIQIILRTIETVVFRRGAK